VDPLEDDLLAAVVQKSMLALLLVTINAEAVAVSLLVTALIELLDVHASQENQVGGHQTRFVLVDEQSAVTEHVVSCLQGFGAAANLLQLALLDDHRVLWHEAIRWGLTLRSDA
jgi:hypothetical protein